MRSLLWKYDKDHMKVYTENQEINITIGTWKNSEVQCQYFFPTGFNTDFLVDKKYKNKILNLFKKFKEPLEVE